MAPELDPHGPGLVSGPCFLARPRDSSGTGRAHHWGSSRSIRPISSSWTLSLTDDVFLCSCTEARWPLGSPLPVNERERRNDPFPRAR
jgi:hypothetical protein